MRLIDLHHLGRRLQDIARRAMGEWPALDADLSTTERIVLANMADHGMSTISELAARTGFAQSRVSTVVATLREEGWVETSTSAADRRCTHVTLVEDMRQLAVVARRSATPVLAAALGRLSPERRSEVIAALDDLWAALKASDPTPTSRRRAG